MNSVRKLRKHLHMTQAAFAELCGISTVSVSRYEAGCRISSTNAMKIAQACQVPIDTVIGSPIETQTKTCVCDSSEEEKLVSDYRTLNPKGKQRLQDMMSDLLLIYSCVKG